MNLSSVLKVTPISIPSAFQELLGNQLAQLRARLKDLNKKSSIEEIHQLRVLTRRTRATCQALQSIQANSPVRDLIGKLRQLTRVLGPIRALDVSLEDLKTLSKQRLPMDFCLRP